LPPSLGEDGVIGAGAAPPIGRRRWRNYLGVQGSIPRFGEAGVIGFRGFGKGAEPPSFEPGSPGFFIASKLKNFGGQLQSPACLATTPRGYIPNLKVFY